MTPPVRHSRQRLALRRKQSELEPAFNLDCAAPAALHEFSKRSRVGDVETEPIAAGPFEQVIRGGAHTKEHFLADVEPFAHAERLPHLMRAEYGRQVPRR